MNPTESITQTAFHSVTTLSHQLHWKRIKQMLQQYRQEAQLLLGDRATRKHAKDCWNERGNDNLDWNDLQMYFKVIKSGTTRKLVYDFLLVVYSNFCRITHCFFRNLMWNSLMTLKYAQDHWQLYHLKAVMWPCKMFGRQWTNEAKIAIFNYPTLIWLPLQRTPANICINLILPETTFPWLHFCRWQYMGSSAHFRTVLPESRRRQPISCRARNRF